MTFDGWTLALQAINFLVLIWILQRFLYKPLLGLIDRRQQATQEAIAAAEEREHEADEARAAYEAQREALSAEREKMLDEARSRLASEQDEMKGAARARAQAELASARSQIAQEKAAAADAMWHDAVELAGQLAQKLLAAVTSEAIAESLLQSALDRLEALPPERLRAFREDVGAGAPLVVASAPGFGAALQARCRERVAAILGEGVALEFSTDDALIVGAELRSTHATVGYSWRGVLTGALEELRSDGRSR